MKERLIQFERDLIDSLFGLDYKNGRNPLMDNYMIKLRKDRECVSIENTHMVFHNDDFYQIWFQSPACRYSMSGKCTICNYWGGRKIKDLMKITLPKIHLPGSCKTVLINTCGSCLDTSELPSEELDHLLEWLGNCPAQNVIFETHWSTLSDDMLKKINDFLPDKVIYYEIGLESANKDTLFYCLNKPSSVTDLSSIMDRLHRYNSFGIVNVLFGIPFLNFEEQIEDTYSSIEFFLEQNADYIVVFPVNIKPMTLPMELYRSGDYSAVSVKQLAEIILRFPDDVLNKINVAWFGDHEEDGVISPTYCNVCGPQTIDLFKRFNNESGCSMRKKYLKDIYNIHCGCTSSFPNDNRNADFCSRLISYYERIKNTR